VVIGVGEVVSKRRGPRAKLVAATTGPKGSRREPAPVAIGGVGRRHCQLRFEAASSGGQWFETEPVLGRKRHGCRRLEAEQRWWLLNATAAKAQRHSKESSRAMGRSGAFLYRCADRTEDKGGRCRDTRGVAWSASVAGGSSDRVVEWHDWSGAWRTRGVMRFGQWVGWAALWHGPASVAGLHCAVDRPIYSFLFIPGIFQYLKLHQTL
jgi:hypothetical protein